MSNDPTTQLRQAFQAAASASVPVFRPSAGEAGDSEKQQFCEMFEAFARLVMEHRQDGFPMAKVVKIILAAPGGGGAPKEVSKLARSAVIEAYDRHRWDDDDQKKYRKEAIEDFANDMSLKCFQRVFDTEEDDA
ncbi:MAG: hypothetical protein GDA40_07770 [Rhodobacteraceae bacterium]|nr:hypothetical protein [Paracoccaceae bacterium]